MTDSKTRRHGSEKTNKAKKKASRPVHSRMNPEDRRLQILNEATDFFADHGLNAQTRALAKACGISQRLLYRYFPTKEALLIEVYRKEIAGPFKAIWLSQLSDRRIKIEDRLILFYQDYFQTIFTAKWLRLFMHSSLSESTMAPDYTSDIVVRVLELIAAEVAFEQGIDLPDNRFLLREICWTLHGGLSHFAIRKHLYRFPQAVDELSVIRIHVVQFIGGFRTAIKAISNKNLNFPKIS